VILLKENFIHSLLVLKC